MNRARIRRITLLDVVLILVLVGQAAGALLLATRGRGEPVARVVSDGRLVAVLRLDQDRVLRVGSTGMSVEVGDGRVRVAESDCPRRICVRTGWISQPGQMIVCVPNRLLVEIAGGRNGYDAETY